MNTDLALLVLRLVVGALVAGHGAQKLFDRFGAGGLRGTAAFLDSLRLRPARAWALLAGLSELGGGALTMLGLLDPLGPIGIVAAMAVAIATAHWGKPIWAAQGGGELPLAYAAAAIVLLLAGPGAYALDRALGLDLGWLAIPALAAAALGVAVALLTREHPPRPGSGAVPSTDELRRPA